VPPPLLVDLAKVDPDHVVLSREQIYERHLPHRHEFMLIDGICSVDRDADAIVAFVDIRANAWWFRGHVPGRPLLPGVLMLEAAAQASAIGACLLRDHQGFLGFGGVDRCKFRDTVTAPSRLFLLCVLADYRPRRIISKNQGVVNGRLVFEADITGLTLR